MSSLTNNTPNYSEMSADELAALANINDNAVCTNGTVVLEGRQLAPQDQAARPVPTVTPRLQRGRKVGATGPKKDDLSNPTHLWAISGRKGSNGCGTIIFVWSVTLETWFEVPRTKCKAAFEQAKSSTLSARLEINEEGQRLLLIG